MLSVQIAVKGTSEAIVKFKGLGIGLHNFKVPMALIGTGLVEYYSGPVYASQGGVLGLRWPTLAASTTKYKARHYPQYATTPLIRTGEMQKAYKAESTMNSVIISNTAPYFKYHQSTLPRKKIPYRPSMAINDPVKSIVKTILEADIAMKLRAA